MVALETAKGVAAKARGPEMVALAKAREVAAKETAPRVVAPKEEKKMEKAKEEPRHQGEQMHLCAGTLPKEDAIVLKEHAPSTIQRFAPSTRKEIASVERSAEIFTCVHKLKRPKPLLRHRLWELQKSC